MGMRTGALYFSLLAIAAVLGAGIYLIGTPPVEAEADKTVRTEDAAAAAGAKILPTEPKLRVEPK